MVKNVTSDFFSKNVYDFKNVDDSGELKFLGKKPVLIDFYANWCGPCRVLEPILDELYTEYDSKVDIYKVNTEDEQELAAAFGVRSLPTLLFIPMEGPPVISPGAPSKQNLKQIIDEKLFNKEIKKDENLDDKVNTFNKLMEKIKAVLK
jgi:thioredoxin